LSDSLFSSLLPLLEKVARTKSVPDEGARHNETHHPLTRLRFAQAPSSTRGEGKKEDPAFRRDDPEIVMTPCLDDTG
jgi:hypothetical protein